MQGNFQIVSYNDYPLIPDKKQPLPISVSESDIRYQLVFEANDNIKCGELLLAWRAKPNGLPHKQTLPRWFYVDELVPLTDGSGKVAAIQYKGHTKHDKMAPVDASALKINLHTALADDQYSELLPKTSPFLIKNVRQLSSALATQLIEKYQAELPTPINAATIVNKLAALNKDLLEIENGYQVSVSGNNIQLFWKNDLPTHEHPALLKQWVQDSDEIRTAYLDVFESEDELYLDDFLISSSDLLIQEPNDIEQGIATLDMLISSENIERFILVIRMSDSDRALVASLELKDNQ
jgi:RecA/RadA recombinase